MTKTNGKDITKVIGILLLCFVGILPLSAKVDVKSLRVENLTNPLGVDTDQPRFSWVTTSDEKDVRQTAYQIIVSDDKGELWNSGKVDSDEQLWIPYAGGKLKSGMQCSWKVKVFTNKGETAWSEPQRFGIGLLKESHWSGRWIGLERLMPGEQRGQYTRLAARYVRSEFKLDKPVQRAIAYVAGIGLHELHVNGKTFDREVLVPMPTDYRKTVLYNTYDITSSLTGENCIGVVLGNGRLFPMRQNKPYKTPVFGLPKCRINILITFTDGTTKRISTDEKWKVTADGPIRSNNEYDGEEYDARQELTGWDQVGYDDSAWLQAERSEIPQGTLRAQMAPGMAMAPFAPEPTPLTSNPSPLTSKEEDVYDALPLEQWAEELQEMAEYYPCLKELFLNVHPHKLPAVWFSSAALFGTLMTRAYYHFWYEPEIIRRLNYCVFIIGDPGAGKNIVEKFYKKIADPMIQADQCLIDAVNRYKDGRTERTTSTKAQKGEALKRPVVGIRVHPARTATGEFIRHMQAAVENIQGRKLNLHMFSFDAELDNVTKNNKGGDWKDREILELKAFHNEEDGQMYANQESVTGMFNVFWNFIYTGTPYALHRKVNQRNFGTGMSTRLAVIPLPDKGMAQRHQQVDPNSNEALREWAYRLDKVEGEIPIEPLNDETFDWQSSHLEIAEFNGDKADRTLLKRIPYYGIGISLPFILMRHWEEWQESKTLTMDDRDKRLCRLAMEIQYKCQQFFFGEMAFNYFADQNKEFVVRKRSTRYSECFRKLPEEFKTQQFMDCFGCSQQAASRAIIRFRNDGVIEVVKYGVYKKVVSELP